MTATPSLLEELSRIVDVKPFNGVSLGKVAADLSTQAVESAAVQIESELAGISPEELVEMLQERVAVTRLRAAHPTALEMAAHHQGCCDGSCGAID